MKYKLALYALRSCLLIEKILRNWSNWFGGKASFIIGRWM